MTDGRRPRYRGVVLLALVPCLLSLACCARAVDGVPTGAPVQSLPRSAEELEPLIVTEVPSGLPRLPDEELDPPAGAKRVEDVARYAANPEREREVLEDYGYRYGWERFWGTGAMPTTSVFVDRFDTRAGAGAYAEDRARNDAEHYEGVLDEHPLELPGGCRMLRIEAPAPHARLSGPAAFVWCGHGVFSVAVIAVAGSVDVAEDEVRAVLAEQLERLPPK